MKFTHSPVIELTINNSTLSLQQDNQSMHVGTSVWPCSLVLAKFADRWSPLSHPPNPTNPNNPKNPNNPNYPNPNNPNKPNPYSTLLDFRNKRGIELGAGCGPAGMALFLLGLTDIVLTDIAPVMPALKHNLKKNKSVLKKNLKTAKLYWANEAQMAALSPPFDVVVAADVVYLEETVGPLVGTMRELMGENGVVLLGYQVRQPEADKLFWEMCREVFEIEKIAKEDLDPEYAYEESDVYIFRKKRDGNHVINVTT